ncbi:MAG: hypothetical protein AAB550_02200 [Patescibacteria group bacterium]
MKLLPESIRAKLKVKHLNSQARLGKFLLTSAFAGTLFLGAPQIPALSAPEQIHFDVKLNSRQQFLLDLQKITDPQNQEQEISDIYLKNFNLKAYAKYEGERLNRSYGLIGAEQHMPRFPGDTAEQHGQFIQSGITPGKGAWGYVPDVEKEKYYVAVQTLYLPDWTTRLAYLRDWYKYRKVVVTNPVNGKTIIAVVADSGPSWWTGKHFGGSPEIMAYLGLNVGMQKGPVVLFFVDDPGDKIPLGPLEEPLKND